MITYRTRLLGVDVRQHLRQRRSDQGPLQQYHIGLSFAVWTASVASNIGTWMQSVGAAWLMTSLTPSPLLVALMQTAYDGYISRNGL
jgi:hypothetical protein